MAEEEEVRRARRPPPERLGEDDRVRVLGPAEARRARLDAAPLGGVDRGPAPARLLDARRARTHRAAGRPVRARAARQAGAVARAQSAPLTLAIRNVEGRERRRSRAPAQEPRAAFLYS